MNIEIKYDGAYPNLCRGTLIVIIEDKEWVFPDYCLESGGCICRSEDWDMWAESGKWNINEYPDGFPEELKEVVLEAVNEQIGWGCCGGCI